MITKNISRLFVSLALLVTALAASPVPAFAMQIDNGGASISARVDDHGHKHAGHKAGKHGKHAETHKSGGHPETETETESHHNGNHK